MKIVRENPDGMTLEEIGEVLGVTRERVRQIEVIALDKLKRGREAGAGEVVELKGRLHTYAFALVECETCGELFLRDGAAALCPECEPDPIPLNMPCHCFDEIAARKPESSKGCQDTPDAEESSESVLSALLIDFFGGLEGEDS